MAMDHERRHHQVDQATEQAPPEGAPVHRERIGATHRGPLARGRGRIYESILETIGSTPLVRLNRFVERDKLAADLVLKLEYLNPLGSVKDRIGLAMVEDAERQGLIVAGRSQIVEPSSGNTGIALAFVAAAKGYALTVVMPESASVERARMLRLMGASVELTPASEGMAGAIARASEMVARSNDAWMARQFDNPANPAAHEAATAEELWLDCAGEIDVLVAGAGTGGTVTGIARALKPRRPTMQFVAVEPAESAVLSGDDPATHSLEGIGPGFHPAVLDLSLIDRVFPVSEQASLQTARECARLEGIPIGISSGAALHAALCIAKERASAGKRIAVIAASSAERYLSTKLFTAR
jgi:cysteine synthase